VLQGVVKHLNMTTFSGQEWVLQQGLSSCPKGQDNSGVAVEESLAFFSAENWLSGNADVKTLDNKLWTVLEDMACRKRYNSLESLRRSLVKAAAEIPLEMERAATEEWP